MNINVTFEETRNHPVLAVVDAVLADVKETEDGMIITGSRLHFANMKGFNDHRIVMAMTVAATGVDGISTIDDAQSINKSYPDFFTDYNGIGGNVNVFISG